MVGLHPMAQGFPTAYFFNMKTLLIAGIFGAGIFLTGCETAVVENRYPRGNDRYYANGGNGYGDASYHTRNVQRTNVYETNVNETNVHRSDTNRTVVKTQSKGGQDTVNRQTAKGSQTQSATKVQQQSTKKVKAKGGDQQGNDKSNEHTNNQQ